jgi:D-alanine-D-alanine ligase
MFRREAEWLYGDGIGSSRAPLAMLEFVLWALRSRRALRRLPLGVLYYTDEGRDARYSAELIRAATAKAQRVLVLRPGNVGDKLITQRRGQRRYRFRVEGEPLRPGKVVKKPDVLRWVWGRLEDFAKLTSRKQRVSVSALDVDTERLPMLLPHRVTVTVLMTYPDPKVADDVEEKMRSTLGKQGLHWELKLISDRPPMRERRINLQLARSLEQVAEEWEIPLSHESSVWPSVAGLVPSKVACGCGVGPDARDLGTPQEAVQRFSLVQRTLLLTQFLAKDLRK